MGRQKPKIVEMAPDDLEEILGRVETKQGTAEDYEAIRTLSHSYVHPIELLKDKNTKIGRLRKLLFDASTEKTDTVLGDKAEASTPSSDDDESESSQQSDPQEDSGPPPKGHGRNGADAYHGGEQVVVLPPLFTGQLRSVQHDIVDTALLDEQHPLVGQLAKLPQPDAHRQLVEVPRWRGC